MEDLNLNRNLEEIKELQTRWNQFHDFVGMAMQQGPSKITPQAELKFLELKSRIAMLHDGFMGGVKHDVKTAQNIIQIVSDCILLKKTAMASDAEKQKFEFDWNECFMLLTETVSSMDEEKKRLGAINERAYKAAQMRDIWRARIHNFLHSALLKWCVVLFGTIGGLIAIEALYGYRKFYTDISITKGFYMTMVGNVWRPFIDKEYEYNDYAEVENEIVKDLKPPDGTGDKGSPIKEDQFKKDVMIRMGYSDGLEEAKKLFDSRKDKTWKMQQYDLTGPNNFFPILFTSSVDAKRFIELNRIDLNKAGAQRQAILDKTFAIRKANLVVIGIGPHPLHTGWVIDRWRPFKPVKNELE